MCRHGIEHTLSECSSIRSNTSSAQLRIVDSNVRDIWLVRSKKFASLTPVSGLGY
jgi:hypothetical protein